MLYLKDDCPEWFCFLDSDNFLTENSLNKIEKTLQYSKSDFFFSDLFTFDIHSIWKSKKKN